jgi:hypothetical protein
LAVGSTTFGGDSRTTENSYIAQDDFLGKKSQKKSSFTKLGRFKIK